MWGWRLCILWAGLCAFGPARIVCLLGSVLVIAVLLSPASLLPFTSLCYVQLPVDICYVPPMCTACGTWLTILYCTCSFAAGTCKQAPPAMLVLHCELSKGYEGRGTAISRSAAASAATSIQARCCLALCCRAVHTLLPPYV